ncbi:carbohydrate ABC transporter permease [Lederbergia citri]|uniref:Sugar ABC transporter permease n=1 Tax=Lederbergia citri TaxID=2833580 RepID=A0A942TC17_9BACI|nr:sugar ABC transporter permease [Lederbergia citri]MBS4193749.1 sugar ABC transporter permease [Lederbergia citri]
MSRKYPKVISHKRKQEIMAAYILITPAVFYLLVFLIGPILYAFILSFQDHNLLKPEQAKFIGLKNYFNLFEDPVFRKALYNTFKFSFYVVPLQTVLSLLLAVVANQNIKGRTFFRVSYYLPSITSMVAISAIFMFLFNRNGIANKFLSIFGFDPVSWFADPHYALYLIIILSVWAGVGVNMLIYLAGLQDIPTSVYESSRIDGASAIQQFFYITVPLLKEKTFFVVIIGLIGTLQIFDQAYIISRGSGGPLNSTMTVVLYLYNKAFGENQAGYASAAAFVLFILIFTLTVLQKKFFDEGTPR